MFLELYRKKKERTNELTNKQANKRTNVKRLMNKQKKERNEIWHKRHVLLVIGKKIHYFRYYVIMLGIM
jgi:hypothetical protein